MPDYGPFVPPAGATSRTVERRGGPFVGPEDLPPETTEDSIGLFSPEVVKEAARETGRQVLEGVKTAGRGAGAFLTAIPEVPGLAMKQAFPTRPPEPTFEREVGKRIMEAFGTVGAAFHPFTKFGEQITGPPAGELVRATGVSFPGRTVEQSAELAEQAFSELPGFLVPAAQMRLARPAPGTIPRVKIQEITSEAKAGARAARPVPAAAPEKLPRR